MFSNDDWSSRPFVEEWPPVLNKHKKLSHYEFLEKFVNTVDSWTETENITWIISEE